MAASNDSQGLKIAVAALASLVVILGVSVYFAYSNYSDAAEKQAKAESDLKNAKAVQANQLRDYKELENRFVGTTDMEHPAATKAILDFTEKMKGQIDAVNTAINGTVQAAQAKGVTDKAVEDLRQTGVDLANGIKTEQNQTLMSFIDRLVQLSKNQANLIAQFSLDNIDLRTKLTSVNGVNADKLAEAAGNYEKAKSDLEARTKQFETDRQTFISKNDALQTLNNDQANEIIALKAATDKAKETYEKERLNLLTVVRDLRAKVEKKETILDVPDGRITLVDHNTNVVRTDLTPSMGVHPQMVFTIFDKNAPGIPSDKPKGTIELTSVDRQGYFVGKITTTKETSDPIRNGDVIYSPVFDRNNPKRFALIGKLDVNRDGRDDTDTVIQLIKASGGVIDYVLPPPRSGKEETGEMTARTSWYVTDERPQFGSMEKTQKEVSDEAKKFYDRQTEILKQAPAMGVRPMPLERLLTYLGHSNDLRFPGRIEAINRDASDALKFPRGRTAPRSTGAGAADSKAEKKSDSTEKDAADDKESK